MVEDGCGKLTDEAAGAPPKRRRSQKIDKAKINNDNNDRQHTKIKQNTVEVGVRQRWWRRWGGGDGTEKYAALTENGQRRRRNARQYRGEGGGKEMEDADDNDDDGCGWPR